MAKRFYSLILLLPLVACAAEPEVYTGVWDGNGKATLPDNSVYEGEFKKGLFSGKGVLIWKA